MGAVETAARANPVGAAFGAFFLYSTYSGVFKLGLPTAYQQIIQGAALVIMLVVDAVVTAVRLKKQEKEHGLEQEKIMKEEAVNG